MPSTNLKRKGMFLRDSIPVRCPATCPKCRSTFHLYLSVRLCGYKCWSKFLISAGVRSTPWRTTACYHVLRPGYGTVCTSPSTSRAKWHFSPRCGSRYLTHGTAGGLLSFFDLAISRMRFNSPQAPPTTTSRPRRGGPAARDRDRRRCPGDGVP